MAVKRGLFIVLEGIDRTGKTMQCKELVKFLSGLCSVKLQKYPDRTELKTGPQIDRFLKTAKSPYERAEEIHCLFSENRRVLDAIIRKDIIDGQTIIADRYSISGIAYTQAKGLSKEFACKTEVGLLKPDLIIYLEADPEKITSKRPGFGDEVLETTEFQKKVRKHMKALFNREFWVEVDASKSVDEIHEAIKTVVLDLMAKTKREPLQSFTLVDFNV